MCDLYLTEETDAMSMGAFAANTGLLHARHPHTIEMTLVFAAAGMILLTPVICGDRKKRRSAK